MKTSYLIFAVCFVLVSCSEPQARRPITVKTSTTFEQTVAQTKAINKIEEQRILRYIELDSTRSYMASNNGFWYRYDQKNTESEYTPKTGDQVLLSYDMRDLNNNIVYSKEDIGEKPYVIDKEDLIAGLQVGIKMMKEGETITFIIPSYNAYGIVGDGDRIGINESIISTLTLLKITQINKDEN